MNSQPAGRRFSAVPLRRAALIALTSGAGLAVAAAFGPIWIVRAGIAIALVAGYIAIRYAWRELRQTREEAGRKSLEQLQSHNSLLTSERQRNREVITVLREHNQVNAERLGALQITIGNLRTEISSLKGDYAALQAERVERDHRITRLRTELAEHVAELQQPRGGGEDAKIVAIPRNFAVADWDALPSAEDLWAAGNHPTVIDLQKLAFPATTEEKRRQA